MAYTASHIEGALAEWGHLHVVTDSGIEFGISRGDTSVEDGILTIDSKRGTWEVPVEKVETVEKEDSGPVE